MLPSTLRALVLSLALILVGCPFGLGDEELTGRDAIIGVWRYTIAGDVQSTLRMLDDGTWIAVDADLALERCDNTTGTWEIGDGVIIAQNLTENGVAVSEPAEELPYSVSGDRLTLDHPGDDPEVYQRFDGPMVTCADYAWPRYTMTASVDGVQLDFSEIPFLPGGDLQQQLASSSMFLSAWAEVPQDETVACVTCKVLELELWTDQGGPIAPGVYTASYGNGEQLIGRATYREAYPSSDVHYRSDESDPGTQPWTGAITVTSASATLFEGTFEFVVYDGRATGPPYPAVSITDGFFRVTYD